MRNIYVDGRGSLALVGPSLGEGRLYTYSLLAHFFLCQFICGSLF